jgi:phage gpG-like protein
VVAIRVKFKGLQATQAKLAQMMGFDLRPLLDLMGDLVIERTQERIRNEKESPEGVPWKRWSIEYAKTRTGGQSLLFDSGDLHGSIEKTISGNTLTVGSELDYAAPNQKTRPFLGISDDDQKDLEDTLANFFTQTVLAA